MEYTIKQTHPCEREISIRIGKELIQDAKGECLEELAREAALPGYRKGKVPKDVLEIQFAEKVKESVIRKLISVALKRITDAEKMKIIASPQVKDLNYSENELKFKIEVELEPEIKLGVYHGIKTRRIPFEIQDREIEEVIEKIRETFASFIPVTREARMNDYLIADYEMEITGKPKEEHKDEWIFLHEHNSLGNFSEKLTGIKSGEERNFEIAISDQHASEELRGKQARFNVKVKDVKEKALPKVDDELAKLAGEYQDLDSLKRAVREDIKRKKEQEQEIQAEQEILNHLISGTSFEVSRGVVERQLEKLVHDAMNRMIQRGYGKEQVEKQHDALAKEFKQEAEKQVRLAFILERIAEKEKIQITPDDLNARFEQLAKQYHLTIEKVKEHFQKEENLESLIEQIINEKVFKFIKANAEITNA